MPAEPSGLVHIPSAILVVGSSVGVELVPAPVFLALRNESADSTAVLYSRCSFAVRGYRTASRLGAPGWVRVLPEHTNCGAEVALQLPVRGHALTVSEIGHVPQELLSRAPYLSLFFHVAGEATPRVIPIAPIAID
jgi:hypothetical protein